MNDLSHMNRRLNVLSASSTACYNLSFQADPTFIESTKPKKPLSAYNLYFQLERKRILEGTNHLRRPITIEELIVVNEAHKNRKGKRVHRKSHGKIGFHDLSRAVTSGWKRLEESTREMIRSYAKMEKQRYNQAIQDWEEIQKLNQSFQQQEHTRGTESNNSNSLSLETSGYETLFLIDSVYRLSTQQTQEGQHGTLSRISTQSELDMTATSLLNSCGMITDDSLALNSSSLQYTCSDDAVQQQEFILSNEAAHTFIPVTPLLDSFGCNPSDVVSSSPVTLSAYGDRRSADISQREVAVVPQLSSAITAIDVLSAPMMNAKEMDDLFS